jgi:ABC-type transport system substrate-binding protein
LASEGKPGGTLKHFAIGDATHFDAVADSSASVVRDSSEPFYTRMLRLKDVQYPDEADGSSEGEIAESWEVSPDKLTVTFKIRQGMIWDRRDPTAGRQIDAEDVVFSWNKYAELNPNGAALAYKGGDSKAPVESMEAIDAETVVATLHAPDASIIPMFSVRDLLFIMPRESDGGFDPKAEVRGHGMFLLEEYQPSSRFTWVKNPDFYVKDRPYPDRVELPIVQDYTQRLAQFRAGNILTDVVEGTQQDVVPTKKDLPETLLLEASNFPVTSGNMITFGWEEGSPWRDVRMRQALSYLLDREGFIDTIDNRDNFATDGLDLAVRRSSVVPGGWSGYWVDPTDAAAFGPEAKYLDLNIEEAKKLITAAGNDGLEFELNMGPVDRYGATYQRTVELYDSFFREAGLNPSLQVRTPAEVWLNQYARKYFNSGYTVGDGFEGVAVVPERSYGTAGLQLYNQFHKAGGAFRGMALEGGTTVDGDPFLNDLTEKITAEFELEAQQALVHELARHATEASYYVPRISVAKAYTVWWPAVGNVGAFSSYANSAFWIDQRRNWWIDSTKAPLA